MKNTWYLFKEPYDKTIFYSKMAAYFAERTYRTQFPYLVNSPETSWFVIEDEHKKVIGFSSFEEKRRGVEIGDVYVLNDEALWKKLVSKTIREAKKLNKPLLFTAVKTKEEASFFQYKGFKVQRFSKNYLYLEMKVPVIE
jgi:hypothetical protein